jgi:hypothetical protein
MDPKTNLSEQSKDTGLAVVLILLLAWYFTGRENFILPAMGALILTMTWPKAFKPLSGLWFGLSHCLGSIVSKIFLSGIFFLMVTPVGLVRRWTGADAMRLKDWKNGAGSVFIDRGQVFSAGDLEKPY